MKILFALLTITVLSACEDVGVSVRCYSGNIYLIDHIDSEIVQAYYKNGEPITCTRLN